MPALSAELGAGSLLSAGGGLRFIASRRCPSLAANPTIRERGGQNFSLRYHEVLCDGLRDHKVAKKKKEKPGEQILFSLRIYRHHHRRQRTQVKVLENGDLVLCLLPIGCDYRCFPTFVSLGLFMCKWGSVITTSSSYGKD